MSMCDLLSLVWLVNVAAWGGGSRCTQVVVRHSFSFGVGGGVQVYSSCGQTFLQLGGSRCTQVVVRHS